MGLSIEIFIHGVPHGNKVWGEGVGKSYLSKFYNAKYSTKEQMLVEVANVGGTKLCFYSFVLGTNVCANDGREGSYFAISVCMNAYYADIQNMYSILNAAYRKICFGNVLKPQGTGLKFCISDFSEVEEMLLEMKSNVIKYIGDFSNNEDIVELQSFPFSQGKGIELNLQECATNDCNALMKQNGSISVSTLFPTKEFSKQIAQKNEEVKKLRTAHEEQLSSIEKKYSERESQKKEQIVSLQNQLHNMEQELNSSRKECANLRQDLNIKENKIRELNYKSKSTSNYQYNYDKDDFRELKSKSNIQLIVTFCVAFFCLLNVCYLAYVFGLEQHSSSLVKLQEGLSPVITKVDSISDKVSLIYDNEKEKKIALLKESVSISLLGKDKFVSDTAMICTRGLTQSDLQKITWNIDSTKYADFVPTDTLSTYRTIKAKADGNVIVSISYDGIIISSCPIKVKTKK